MGVSYAQRLPRCEKHVPSSVRPISFTPRETFLIPQHFSVHSRRKKDEKWTVRLRVQNYDPTGRPIPNSYHITTYTKTPNLPDFEAIQRREAITNKLDDMMPPPAALTSGVKQEVKEERGEKRSADQAAMREGLRALKQKVAGT